MVPRPRRRSLRSCTISPPTQSLRRKTAREAPQRAGLRAFCEQLAGFVGRVSQLRDQVQEVCAPAGAGPARATARILTTPGTPTTLRSSKSVPAASSFGSTRPQWEGRSKASIRVGGAFTGVVQDAYTFIVLTESAAPWARGYRDPGGDNGRGKPRVIEVRNSVDLVVDRVRAHELRGGELPLTCGLIVRLGRGRLVPGDRFTVSVNPGRPGGIPLDTPVSRMRDFGVYQGTFEVNGRVINALNYDTINDVLLRIGDSGAGVCAGYDTDVERFVIRSTCDGPVPIAVNNDSTGLVRALGWSEPELLLGSAPCTTAVLEPPPPTPRPPIGQVRLGAALAATVRAELGVLAAEAEALLKPAEGESEHLGKLREALTEMPSELRGALERDDDALAQHLLGGKQSGLIEALFGRITRVGVALERDWGERGVLVSLRA